MQKIIFNPNEDYDPDSKKPLKTQGKGKSTLSNFGSTDTPDFYDPDDDDYGPDFSEGWGGSSGKMQEAKDHDHDPGIAGALEVDPDIHEVQAASYDGVEFVFPESGPTQEIDIGSTEEWELEIPAVMGWFEDYVVGFTADSHPDFKVVSPQTGRMNRKGEEPAVIEVRIKGSSEQKVGYLCFMYPDEPMFNNYIKVSQDPSRR